VNQLYTHLLDWTVRCGWLQVASCSIMLMRAARLAGLLLTFILVVIGALGAFWIHKLVRRDL